MPGTDTLPGTIGPYRILGRLGKGGMAEVFRAEQQSLGRTVALKVVAPQFIADAAFRGRFLREAKASARVSHPNVVTCFDAGEADGRLYLALELMEGGDLLGLLQRSGGRLDERPALVLLRDCLAGLQALADAGVVHRDIKPANIFLSSTGSAKLADLGLARWSGTDATTTPGMILGTPAYMAPEQVRGESDLDARADLFSLGATLWHLLAGASPFTANDPMSTLMRVLNQAVPDARETIGCAPGTARLLQRLLERDRTKRHRSPAEALAEVDALLADGGASRKAGSTAPAKSPPAESPQPTPSQQQPQQPKRETGQGKPGTGSRTAASAAGRIPTPPNGAAMRLNPAQVQLLAKRISVDQDGVRAWLVLAPGASFPRAILDQLLASLEIVHGIDPAAVSEATRPSDLPRRIVLARGEAPAPGVAGRTVRGETIPPMERSLQIRISDDRLTAWALTRPGTRVPKEELEQELKGIGLRFGLVPDALKRLVDGPPDPTGRLVIARGRAMVNAHPAGFVLNAAVQAADVASIATAAGGRTATDLQQVHPGDLLARWKEGTPAVPGMDVLGHSLEAPPVRQLAPEACAGEGTELGRDGEGELCLRAVRAGVCQQVDGGAVRVVAVREIAGDLGPDDPPVETDDLVVVRGSILPGARISTASDVVVLGDLDDAHVEAGGAIRVAGAIGDGDRPLVAAGEVTAASLGTRPVLAGSVRIGGEVRNSTVTATGSIEAGHIVGGKLVAGGDVTVACAGDRDGTTTELWAGHHLTLAQHAELAKLAERRANAERTRVVAELTAATAELTAAAGAQRRVASSSWVREDIAAQVRARLVMLEARRNDLDRAAEDARQALARAREAGSSLRARGDDAHARIHVTGVAWEGVVLRLADVEPETLHQPRTGVRLGG